MLPLLRCAMRVEARRGWSGLLDEDDEPRANCPDYPMAAIDAMYSIHPRGLVVPSMKEATEEAVTPGTRTRFSVSPL